jgi:hypothetical protein
MENQEPKKAPETTVESDASARSLGKNQGAEVESDASSHQNVEVENEGTKKAPEITAESDVSNRSPGKDRDYSLLLNLLPHPSQRERSLNLPQQP